MKSKKSVKISMNKDKSFLIENFEAKKGYPKSIPVLTTDFEYSLLKRHFADLKPGSSQNVESWNFAPPDFLEHLIENHKDMIDFNASEEKLTSVETGESKKVPPDEDK